MKIEEILAYLKNPITLYVGAGLIALLFLLFIFRMIRTKKLRSIFDGYSYDYNSLKSVPLLFKLNKATALAKVSQEIRDLVEAARLDFENLQENFKNLMELLSECEDNLELGKTAKVRKKVNQIEDLMVLTKVQVDNLDMKLEEVLQQESQLRLRINKLKDIYQDIKHAINSNVDRFAYCIEVVDEQMALVEGEFSSFENAIIASKFADGTQIIDSISQRIANLNVIINQSPQLIEKAKNELPQLLTAVRNQYITAIEEGCCFNGIPVETTLDNIGEAIKTAAVDIRSGKVSEIVEQFNAYSSQLNNLALTIKKEQQALQEFKTMINSINALLASEEVKVTENIQLNQRLKERYRTSGNSQDIKQQDNQLNINRRQLNNIMNEFSNQRTLTSNLLLRLKELELSINQSLGQLDAYYRQLREICKDEDEAKENLLKLNLLINQTIAAVNRHYLPSISETYHYDLKLAQEKIASVEALLAEDNLQVPQLKVVIAEANEFVRGFFNSVNNIVGTCKLAEQTIVFCNKYRATFSDIDSELTKAEMFFNNGEYSASLNLALPIAQRMFPNNYADLIKEYSS